MKKLVSLTLTLLMVVFLVSCADNNNFTNDSTLTNVNTESLESQENIDSLQTDSVENSNDIVEWKEFLKEYEKWVDDYIAIVKKQKENPSDLTILTDYSKMLTQMSEWSRKSDDMAKSIKSTEDALEYSKEVLRIVGKLTEIGQ
ncbi:MAG: hypothetical protein IKU48_05885 [Clostridia bacterium]|nr:hypothetical protein [Clostridia bacterium]